MKATGMVRRVDELGRIVLPIEMRRSLGIEERDLLELYVEGDDLILRKYEPACTFCGGSLELRSFQGKNICANCLAQLKEIET